MNQAQRKFLIDRIEANVKKQIDALNHSDTEQPPSLENYFYGLALSGKLEIQTQEHIKKVMSERAMKHTAQRYSETWLGTSQGDLINRASVKIPIRDLFVVPKEYDELWTEYRRNDEEKRQRIRQIQIECDTLVTRIQLASDKTLEKMISEVDDMGDVSLMDTKLKSLIAPHENKMIR
jgi:hypothetical protein